MLKTPKTKAPMKHDARAIWSPDGTMLLAYCPKFVERRDTKTHDAKRAVMCDNMQRMLDPVSPVDFLSLEIDYRFM